MTVHLDVHSEGKNKERASSVDGSGTSSGIVLSLNTVSTSYYAVAYTIPLLVGSSHQNLSLQVDTGSSDLWIASTSCSSAACSATGGHLYDPTSSQSTNTTLSMQYLAGSMEGPIVWDQVQIGDYVIPNQALAAARTVDYEPLSSNYDGILGLALPSNSEIQRRIPASTGDAPDGATFSSNLFSLTPATSAPSQPFFSLTLARPGFNQIPSLLGIGSHPSEIVPDPSRIRYSSLVSDSAGQLFWKTTIRAITVYVDGQPHPVTLQSLSGASEPTALLDSGVPLIITTPALANGIYGAMGISPASDGNYYVPCTTPINMTITLDGQDELALHPLDLTTEPVNQPNSQYCIGLIQTDPSQLTATSSIGDMILGVPFMRNVYTVMAYEQPDAKGNFNNSIAYGTNPTLGLLGLTNATQAIDEFNQARVPKQSSNTNGQSGSLPHSVGFDVLIGLIGFFVLCLLLFALRYACARRRLWRSSALGRGQLDADGSDQKVEYGAYRSMRNHSPPRSALLYDALPKAEDARYTLDSNRTRVADDDLSWTYKLGGPSTTLDLDDPWDPRAGNWRDTIVGTEAGETASLRSPGFPPHDHDSPQGSPDFTSALLTPHDDGGDLAEFGIRSSMAGIGTAARGSIIEGTLQRGWPSFDSIQSSTPLRQAASSLRTSHSLAFPDEPVDTFGDADRTL